MVAAYPAMRSPAVLSLRQEKRIVAIGDSLIYGYGDPEGGGWVERLRRRWLQPESPGHAVYNLGIRGDSVQRVSQRLTQEFQTRGELRNRVPDLILLTVGMNDSARVGKPSGRFLTSPENFEFQIETLLDQAADLCPVLFIGMTPVLAERMPFVEILYYDHASQAQYNQVTLQACQQRQIPYLNVLDLWLNRGESWWRSRVTTDGIHPNTLGHRTLLEDITAWTAFQELI